MFLYVSVIASTVSGAQALAAAKVRKKKLSSGRGKMDKTTPYTVDDLLTRADECMDSFQLELACKFCERALEIDPNSVRVLDTLGPLLLETGETDRAIEISSLYSTFLNRSQLGFCLVTDQALI